MTSVNENELFFKNEENDINEIDGKYVEIMMTIKFQHNIQELSNEQMMCGASYALNKIDDRSNLVSDPGVWRTLQLISIDNNFSNNLFKMLIILNDNDLIEFLNKTKKSWLLSNFFSKSSNFKDFKDRIKSLVLSRYVGSGALDVGPDVAIYFCDLDSDNETSVKIFLESIVNYDNKKMVDIYLHPDWLKKIFEFTDLIINNDYYLKILSEKLNDLKTHEFSKIERINSEISRMLLMAASVDDVNKNTNKNVGRII